MTCVSCSAKAHRGEKVRWGPVAAAAVIGLSLFATLSSLWTALAHGNGTSWLNGALPLMIGCSAAAAFFTAGLLAGLFCRDRSDRGSAANGVATWGLSVVTSLAAIVPGTVAVMALGDVGPTSGGLVMETALWTFVGSVSFGLVLAPLGAVLGGAMRQPALVPVVRLHEGGRSADPESHLYGDPTSWADARGDTRSLRVAGPGRGVGDRSGVGGPRTTRPPSAS